MTPCRLALATALLALGAPASAQDAPPALAATYVCDGGAVLQVAYLNPAAGPSLAVIGWAGKLVPMQAGPTGSGVRYVTLGDGEPLAWHTKGPDAFLARDDADETMLVEGCRTRD